MKPELSLEALEAEVVAHIVRHLGTIEGVFQVPLPGGPPMDLFHVPPTEAKPFHSLVSFGMSHQPMPVPPEADDPARAELMLALPKDWRFTLNDPHFAWPIRLLAMLAALPARSGSWLGFGHSLQNGDPPKPYAEGTGMSAVLIAPPLSTFPEFQRLELSHGETMGFHAVIPLYPAELDMKNEGGTATLLAHFDKEGVSELLDPGRTSVAGLLIQMLKAREP